MHIAYNMVNVVKFTLLQLDTYFTIFQSMSPHACFLFHGVYNNNGLIQLITFAVIHDFYTPSFN